MPATFGPNPMHRPAFAHNRGMDGPPATQSRLERFLAKHIDDNALAILAGFSALPLFALTAWLTIASDSLRVGAVVLFLGSLSIAVIYFVLRQKQDVLQQAAIRKATETHGATFHPGYAAILNVRVGSPKVAWAFLIPLFVLPILMPFCLMYFSKVNPAFVAIGAGIVFFSTFAPIAAWLDRSNTKKIAGAAARTSNDSVSVLVEATAETLTQLPNARTLQNLLAVLRERGLDGRVVLHWWSQRPTLPSEAPLTVPFEPIPLDETSAAFYYLESQSSAEEGSSALQASDTVSAALRTRALKRAFVQTGLWMGIVVWGLIFLGSAIECLRAGRISNNFLTRGALLVLMVAAPIISRARMANLWFLVPSGLVMRTTSWRKKGVIVHLFTRLNSVLLFRPARKGLWLLAVADNQEFGLGQVSEKEMNLLLRAWLSPIPPPSADRLIDLT